MDKEKTIILTDNEILRDAMAFRRTKQTVLAEKLGMKQPSLSGIMNRNRMGLDSFLKVLNALDFDVVIKDRNSGDEVWKVKA